MIRIGELARRAGVSPELLRAWERRYRVVSPSRTDGGFRLYGDEDVARVRRMRELVAQGMSAAEAAGAVRGVAMETDVRPRTIPTELTEDLGRALASLDEDAAHRAIDRLLAAVTLEAFLTDVTLPMLREIGERWQAGHTSVGHEHFATTVLRGRLLGLARGWDRGAGRRAALACIPGELHDVGLIAFGLALWRRGWRIVYFGQDTPLDSLAADARQAQAALAVLSSVDPALFERHVPAMRTLARALPLAVGGAGASERLAKRLRARLLPADLVEAAGTLSEAP